MSNNKPRILIIGAGMSGLGTAMTLLEHSYPCTLIESNQEPGGLAGNFSIKHKYFPLGYHHILYQDKPLLALLKKLGLYEKISWKKGKVLFAINNKIYNLENPLDFLRFPLPWIDKLYFIKLMLYCVLKKNWDDDLGNAREWLDSIAGENVRKTIFDPLMDIKYGLPSDNLSANWLGSRLHYQEFSKPLGYIPSTDWTKVVIDALEDKVKSLGGKIITKARVKKINLKKNLVTGITYVQDEKDLEVPGNIIVNTAPPHIFLSFLDYSDESLKSFEYLDALSMIVETKQKLPRELYLLSCLNPRYSFGGIFMLSSLNSTIGVENGTVINFFTTLSQKSEYLRKKTASEILEIYKRDFEKLFGFTLKPEWYRLNLIHNYSPKFLRGYRNINQRGVIKGLYFAGNYLTYPIITSTGSAFASGEKVAKYIMHDYGTH